MVNYHEKFREEREASLAEELLYRQEMDREYGTILQDINKELGTQLNSFDEFEQVNEDQLCEHIVEVATAIQQDEREPARIYAVDAIVNGLPEITVHTLSRLFLALPSDHTDFSGPRDRVANAIIQKVKPKDAEVLVTLLRQAIGDTHSAFVLLYGIPKAKIGRSTALQLLKDALKHPSYAWPASDVAKKIKARELLPDLKDLAPKIKDKEILRRVNKAIEYLNSLD